jgi:hypothetical protein
LDANGFVNTGRFADKIRIKKHLGVPDQLVDSDLMAEVPEIASDFRLRECAYVYVRFEWDRDTFPAGIPNISAWLKGKKITDTRDQSLKWTGNTALIARDYLTAMRPGFGFGVNPQAINDVLTNAAANTCDEFVITVPIDLAITAIDADTDILTISGDRLEFQTGDKVHLTAGTVGGLSSGTDYFVIVYQREETARIRLASSFSNALAAVAVNITGGATGTLRKMAEPRYMGGGIITIGEEKGENLKKILSGMAGQAVYAGGKWLLFAGEYQTPTISFDESDLAGGIKVSTKIGAKERFNTVQGIYTSPLNSGNPADYPIVKNSTYEAVDGKQKRRGLDLDFTSRPHTAQRIAKIALERMRQEIIFTVKFKLTAFKVQVGDNFMMNFTRYGWNNKIFEVLEWRLNNDNGAPVIEMMCRENHASVYDWNNGEETRVDPAPNSSLPNPFTVAPPTGLHVTPVEVRTASGDLTYEFEIGWTPPNDPFVTSGGYYDVQFKRSTSAVWRRSFRAEDDDIEIAVKQVDPGINYDVRMRSVNYLGVRSNYQSLFGFTVSSPSGATIALDYRFVSETDTQSIAYGVIIISAGDNQINYGEVA